MAKSSNTSAGVRLRINGSEHLLPIEPRVTLLDALREYAQLNGTMKERRFSKPYTSVAAMCESPIITLPTTSCR